MIAIRVAVLLSFSLSAQASAQARAEEAKTPEIRTAGTAQRTVRPDLATVTLQFSAEGGTPREAGSRLAAKADSLRRALGTLGIPRDSLVNRARWYWWRGRMEIVPLPVRWVLRTISDTVPRVREAVQDTIYRAHDAIEVRIRDLTKVGAVLDTAMGRGLTEISGVQFTATDVSAAQDEALREATVRARRQAEVIAAAGGMQLGAVLSLSTQSDYMDAYRSYGFGSLSISGATADGSVPTVVVQPSVPVSVTVYGRWALVAKP